MFSNKKKSNLIKEVILKPTYNGTGLFNKKGEAINYEDLNISEKTIKEIEDWIGWFWDTFYDSEDFDHLSFYDKGVNLALKIKSELGSEIKVFYDDREVYIDDSGNVTIEEKNFVIDLVNKLDMFFSKEEFKNNDRTDEHKRIVSAMKFLAYFNILPTEAKIGELELKSTNKLEENIKNSYYDYCKNVINFFKNVNDFYFPNLSQMRKKIEKKYYVEEETSLNDEEFLLEYLYDFKLQIDETIKKFLDLFERYKMEVGDPYGTQNIFFNAYCSNYHVPIKEWTSIMNLIEKKSEVLISDVDKVKIAEKIALKYHKKQPYGDHIEPDDYYHYHLNLVREQAKLIAKNEKINIHKVEITALLHDILEDTNYSPEELLNHFGKSVYEAVKLLSYDKKINHEEYLKRISKNKLARIIKTADRYINITQLKDIKDTVKREKLFLKYLRDYPLFFKYDIYPEHIEKAFRKLLL